MKSLRLIDLLTESPASAGLSYVQLVAEARRRDPQDYSENSRFLVLTRTGAGTTWLWATRSPITTPGASRCCPTRRPKRHPKSPTANGGVGSGSGETYVCYFDDFANEIVGNKFSHNGAYGNPTIGDIGEVSNPQPDGNCWHNNVELGGGTLTSYPPEIQTTHGTCGQPNSGEPPSSVLAAQTTCDSQLVAPCPPVPGEEYPRSSNVKLLPLPQQRSMANPCGGVPANSWCSTVASSAARAGRRH
jgi:hypothetical protein